MEQKIDIRSLKGDYKKFQDEIKERGIEYLIHFTTTSNLSSILENGKLMSREILESNDLAFDIIDSHRYDDLKQYINLSLSGPNTEMFKAKRRDYKDRNWCVLKIDPKHIYDRETRFSYHNAAHTVKLQDGISGDLSQFKKLFKQKLDITNSYGTLNVVTRDTQLLPKYPTCVQAEILVKDSIPLESILEVCFESKEKMEEAKAAMHSHDTRLFKVDKEIFSPDRSKIDGPLKKDDCEKNQDQIKEKMGEAEAAKGSLDCSKIDLRRELKKHFGFERFKSYQTDKQKFNQGNVINSLLKGHDVFVIMPTGGGKSLCYQLPAILTERKVAFVISPLIALMKNQVDAIRGNAQDDSVAHVMNSTLSKKDRDQVLKDLKESKTKLLYVAPESFSKESNLEEFKKLDVSFVAIDEAHCISEWGHDFRPEYRNIRKTVDLLGENIPVMALTATATKKVQKDIIKNLRMEAPHVFKASFNRSNLYYEVRPKTAEVNNEIVRFIKQSPERKSGIIYCLARKDTEYVASVLQENGINALPYHAGLKAKERVEHQEKFLNDRCDVMVATIAFGLGIDKPDVRYVIHHSIPKNIESYYQETGRAGRDGKEGHCLAFFNEKDIEKLESFSDSKTIIEKERNGYLLEEMVGYVETAISRRKFLLNYFGEKFDNETGPGGDLDDNVRFPKKLIEVKKEFKTLLDVIEQTKANYKTKELAKILSGKTNALIKSHETEKTSFFGIGKERKEEWWKSLIRQSIVKEYLKKNIENYGVVEITEKGNRVKKQNKEIFISEPQIVQAGRQQSSSDSVKMMSDPLLLKILMETRKKVAREKNVPPYTVFQESSLEEMCLKYPITKKELLGIAGVGVGKAEKFGQPFIDVIQDYVKENDVVRPDDLIIKTKKTNSLLKPLIIQSIDKKLSLEEITGAQKISRENLLEEMEKIVKSGTKLDIYNWVEDLFDEEAEDQLYDFLIQEESDDFQKLMDEFGDRYEEEDLRVFRLYFMSQTAN